MSLESERMRNFLEDQLDQAEKILKDKPCPSVEMDSAESVYSQWLYDDAGADLDSFLEDWITRGELNGDEVGLIQEIHWVLGEVERLQEKAEKYDAIKRALD